MPADAGIHPGCLRKPPDGFLRKRERRKSSLARVFDTTRNAVYYPGTGAFAGGVTHETTILNVFYRMN